MTTYQQNNVLGFLFIFLKYYQLLLRFFNFNSPRHFSMASLGNKNLYWISKNELTRNTGFMSSLAPPLLRQFLLLWPASNCLIHPLHCTGLKAHRSFHKVILPVKTTWPFCLGSFLLLQQTRWSHIRIIWLSEQNNMQPGLRKSKKDLDTFSCPFRKWLGQLGATGNTMYANSCQNHSRCGLEQPGLVKGVTLHGRVVELDNL